MMISPTMRAAFSRANTTPSSLFSHPSITSLNIPSISFPIAASARNTARSIMAKATILSTCSEAEIYWLIHPVTILAKRADAHIPAMMEMMEMACAMKPFLIPCTIAGIKHIKRMISNVFIFLVKIVYLQIEFPRRDFVNAKIGNYFQNRI